MPPSEGPEEGAPTLPAARAWRRWLPRALLEGALIAASVLLGLAASDWRDRRVARERAAQALTAITAELDSNRVLVRRARAHHREVADSVARYVAASVALPQRIYFGGMFNPARVLDVAWQSARDGGAVQQLPYPLVLRLSRVHARQAQYHDLYEAVIQGSYNDLLVRGIPAAFRDNAASWEILLRDFADREETLEQLYAEILPEVRRAAPR